MKLNMSLVAQPWFVVEVSSFDSDKEVCHAAKEHYGTKGGAIEADLFRRSYKNSGIVQGKVIGNKANCVCH